MATLVLTREKIAKMVSEQTSLAVADVERVVAATFEVVGKHIKEGGEVDIRRFGSFRMRVRKARIGRNPGQPNGDLYEIPEHTIVKFVPAKAVKLAVLKLPVEPT